MSDNHALIANDRSASLKSIKDVVYEHPSKPLPVENVDDFLDSCYEDFQQYYGGDAEMPQIDLQDKDNQIKELQA